MGERAEGTRGTVGRGEGDLAELAEGRQPKAKGDMVPLHERWAKPKKEGLVKRIISARRAPTAERQREQDKEAWGMSRPERERRLMVDIWYKRFPQPDWIESPAAREARIDQVARTMKLDAFDSRTWELECPNREVARQREQQPERARDRCPERDYGPSY